MTAPGVTTPAEGSPTWGPIPAPQGHHPSRGWPNAGLDPSTRGQHPSRGRPMWGPIPAPRVSTRAEVGPTWGSIPAPRGHHLSQGAARCGARSQHPGVSTPAEGGSQAAWSALVWRRGEARLGVRVPIHPPRSPGAPTPHPLDTCWSSSCPRPRSSARSGLSLTEEASRLRRSRWVESTPSLPVGGTPGPTVCPRVTPSPACGPVHPQALGTAAPGWGWLRGRCLLWSRPREEGPGGQAGGKEGPGRRPGKKEPREGLGGREGREEGPGGRPRLCLGACFPPRCPSPLLPLCLWLSLSQISK